MNEHSQPGASTAHSATVKLPVIEEDLEVLREQASTGAVRVRIGQRDEVRVVNLDAVTEEVDVERIQVGREVDQVVPPWRDGDALVVPVYEETLVLQRRLVLKEEIRLKSRTRRQEWQQEVALRRDEAHVERRHPDGSWYPASNASPLEEDSGSGSTGGLADPPDGST